MSRFSFLTTFLLALRAVAQQSHSYTDSNTGITFQTYWDAAGSGFSFGVALPEDDSTTDFIGQIVTPVTEGWGGVSLGGSMSGHLLVVAWPNGEEIVGSLREAASYATPPVYAGDATLSPISAGTFVNSTAFSYTFLCSGCITGDSKSFLANATSSIIGWAYSDSAVTTPSDATSVLTYHSAGFGLYGASISASQSADYATWAAMASASNSTGSSGNGTTTPTPGGNTTTPVSGNTTATISNVTYDYIVAGGGPAGLIVAERIAESGASVLLIERGAASLYSSGGQSLVSWNDTITQYDVPALAYYLSSMKDTSEYCTDTASQAGCILGGGTMVNALMYVKPQEVDFDDKWPSGWKWADVESAAQRLYERNPGTILPSSDGQRYDQGAYDVLSKFFSSVGFNQVNALEDVNSKHNVYSYPVWSISDGLRAGPVRNYLPLAQKLSNFKLQLNTKVIRAVRTNSTITGVEIEDNTGARQIINVNTGGKVILSSGALSTPRILFNSGIGPADQIKIVQSGSTSVTLPEESAWIDLPVGQNLQDHPIFTLKFDVKDGLSSLSSTAFTAPSSTNVELFAKGAGLLSQSGQRLNFWTSVETSDGTTRYIQGTCNSPSNNTVQMKVYLTHGLTSSGVLGITSSGSTEFTTNPWMNTDMDKEAVTTFLDQLLAYTRQANSTISYQSTTGNTNVTGADLISNYITGAHFVGTAKMGTDETTSVVGTDTKVHGTDNLFVVDASMHPDLPTGNTQAIIMVAAEAAAAKILALDGSSGDQGSSESSPVLAASATLSSSAVTSSNVPASVSATAVASSVAQVTSAPSVSITVAPEATQAISAIDQLTTALPSELLTSALPTAVPTVAPNGTSDGDLPTSPLPAGTTLKDLLDWIKWALQNLLNSGRQDRGRSHTRAFTSSQMAEVAVEKTPVRRAVPAEEPVHKISRRSTPMERRSLDRYPLNPDKYEDEEYILKRTQWERASFLDSY